MERIKQQKRKFVPRKNRGKNITIKRVRRFIQAQVFIYCGINNTIMTLTTLRGNTLMWASAGSVGFKGTRRSTAHAAGKVGEALALKARKLHIKYVNVVTKGFGYNRDAAIRGLGHGGLFISVIMDETPIAYNGCRRRKVRRV